MQSILRQHYRAQDKVTNNALFFMKYHLQDKYVAQTSAHTALIHSMIGKLLKRWLSL